MTVSEFQKETSIKNRNGDSSGRHIDSKLIENSDLSPITRHARWFIDSLHVLGLVAAGFGAYSLFRPVTYRYAALPHERSLAGRIVEQSGRSSYDFLKPGLIKHIFSRIHKGLLLPTKHYLVLLFALVMRLGLKMR